MSFIALNAQQLSEHLGEEIPEVYVIVAKHEVQGFDSATIADALGVSLEDILEARVDPVYKTVLMYLKAEYARIKSDTDLTYDSLEAIALQKLHKKAEVTSDSEFLFKVAVMSNRAVRRNTTPRTLDPSLAPTRVPITLTTRYTRRYTHEGSEEIAERSVSVLDGSVVNPSFKDVDDLLQVTVRPALSTKISVRTRTPGPQIESVDALLADYSDD